MFFSWCVHSGKGQNPAGKLLVRADCTPAAWRSTSAVAGDSGQSSEVRFLHPSWNVSSLTERTSEHHASRGATVQGQHSGPLRGVASPPMLLSHLFIHFENILSPFPAHLGIRNICYSPALQALSVNSEKRHRYRSL